MSITRKQGPKSFPIHRLVAQAPSGVMEEQILETRLRDLYIGQLNRRRGGETGNLGYERATTIGVDINATITIVGRLRTHLSDAGQRFESLDQFRRMRSEAHAQQISTGNRSLQLRRRA